MFDRTLLRAGETVHMKHVLRRETLSGFAFPDAAARPAKLRLRHEGTGETVDLDVDFDAGGVATTDWAIPREATLLAHLRRSFPGVRDVHLPLGGVGRYQLYVQLRKTFEGEAKNVILGAFGAHYDLKQVIVVDDDVNIHDPEQVEWAVATRFQADRDLVVVSGAQGSIVDPSTDHGVSAKMGLDATKPLKFEGLSFVKTRIPGAENVDLARDLDPAGLAAISAALEG